MSETKKSRDINNQKGKKYGLVKFKIDQKSRKAFTNAPYVLLPFNILFNSLLKAK